MEDYKLWNISIFNFLTEIYFFLIVFLTVMKSQ